MECIVINTCDCSEIVWLETIVYCAAEGSYTKVHLNNNRYVYSSKNLSWFERNLKSVNFVRIHRSFIVNMLFISRVFKNDGKVGLSNGDKIPMSHGKTKRFWQLLNSISNNSQDML